jgi:RNase P subunit RPR2
MGREPDEWQFTIICRTCRQPIGIGKAPSIEEVPIGKHRAIILTCPKCSVVHRYEPSAISRSLVSRDKQ